MHALHDALARSICDRSEFGVNYSDGIKRDQGKAIVRMQLTRLVRGRVREWLRGR
jgi:hypothetical protein